jgi:hypothetical protein
MILVQTKNTMKYIIRVLGSLLVVWAVLVPFASQAGAQSFLYALKVKVNDPIFAFFQITAEGRGESYIKQLDANLAEYTRAVFSGDKTSEDIAKDAVYIAWNRARQHASASASSGNYKVAETVRTNILGLLVGHRQVLNTMVRLSAIPRPIEDFGFLTDLLTVAEKDRSETAKKFLVAYQKEQLVRGIDGRIISVEAKATEVKMLFQAKSNLLQDDPRAKIQEKLNAATDYIASARNNIGLDNYIESYKYADDAEAVLLETAIVIRASVLFGIAVLPEKYLYEREDY